MTAIEILYRDFGLGDETDPNKMESALAYEYFGGNDVDKLINCMNEFARLCCDKQKEICANEAQCGSGWEGSASWVDTDSILNSPYPEELL